MKRWFKAALLMGVLEAALAGCGGGSQSDVPPGDPVPRQGSLRMVNTMPDGGSIVGVLSGQQFGNVAFGESTILAKTIVSRYVVSIVAPTPGGATAVLVDQEPVDLTQEDEVSLIMIDSIAAPTLLRTDNIEIDFGVDLTKPATWPPPDYQIVHASTVSGPVDVYVTEASVPLGAVAPTATLSFGEVTPIEVLDPLEMHRVRVTPVGGAAVLFDSGAFSQTALQRSIYLILDHFGPGGEAFRVADLNPAGVQNFPEQTLVATLRFANLIPDVPAVDVYLGPAVGAPTFEDVAYGTTSAYLAVAPVLTTVNVTPANDPATILYTVGFTPTSGQARTMYTSGLASTMTVTASVLLESLRPITGSAQFSVVNAAPSAGTVDIYLTAPGQPISDTAPILRGGTLMSSTGITVGGADYDLTVTRTGTSTELIGPVRMTLAAANVYDALLFDAAGGGAPLQFAVATQALP